MALLPNSQSVTEDLSFFKGIIIGCGEASALVMAHILKGTPISPGEVTNLITSAARANQLSGAGFGQTPANVQWDLAQYGITSTVAGGLNSAQAISDTISKALNSGKPIELGVSYGAALTGEPSGLRGHYITIVGNSANGWLVADPNTAASKTGGFVTDTTQQLLAANPFAAIIPDQTTGTGVGNQQQTNPLDIAGAISNLGNSIAAATNPNTILNAIGQNVSQRTGITSFTDFLWRSGFVIFAVSIGIIGLIAIIFDFLNKSNIQIAGTRV